ncbi:hypothetical protein O4H53_26975 [Sulfitobacter sp. G21635-S1]|uniref:hypothetical protein n=1 Tax=Sulfitobacter sp. G21635-S1 TaxID=3014043 RepID=UPI0022AF602E|nr:hypothetical protein [Sulfitobacter sp. G21635-S1]MCZ4259195.1 hypothetical protein [Sulfitobacter sp. G21635-S1]
MITFEAVMTGSQLGRQFANDPEETAYLLRAIVDDAPEDFCTDVADYERSSETAAWLRGLADAMDPPGPHETAEGRA